ncbi:histidine kinase [Salinarimonas ramus]|uniref:Uncharacterized protein n=1 Tax=Salinarimonas ramus TaxID=690164 RepID=A0A917V2F8_9HYPH|nr:histidine kinase [Salinarimonas ramus]GGK22243.1 hypothetical protein GCM10011322_06150 [Salinarimonas ramus]
MADYYPLIARAVQGLPDPSPSTRSAVYDRARSALMAQLRSLDPPLSDEDIDREGEALDAAIARVEADYAPPAPEPDAEPAPGAYDAYPEPEPYPESTAYPEPEPYPEPYREQDAYGADEPYPEPAPPPAARAWPEAQPVDEAAPVEAQNFTIPEPRRRPAYGETPPEEERADEDDGFVAAAPPPPPETRARPRIDARNGKGGSGGGRARIAIIAGIVAAVIGAIAATALSLSEEPVEIVAEAPGSETAPPPVDDGKIVDRVGGEAPVVAAAPETTSQASLATTDDGTIAVAQRAVLYEEDPLNPQGEPRAAAGRAVWTLEPGGQGEPVVRVTVEIPDPRLRLVMLIRRNLDPTLPASHTIDLSFETGDMESRRIRDIGLLQLKDEETIRGAPVAGLPVPVRDNLFLIGLSSLPRDIERNTVLMTDRNWIDLPVRLASGQRAILSFEKGASGDRILDEAFAEWSESTVSAGGN